MPNKDRRGQVRKVAVLHNRTDNRISGNSTNAMCFGKLHGIKTEKETLGFR